MGKKEFLRQIESLKERIREHELKIDSEMEKSLPNKECIKYWQKEIKAFENAIEKARKRLRRGR